ncbi:unnamed protein product [Nesidiocoris tenuis]|uniref:Uncharacterized protein n=1 Tax=Nesidiocoris tenuis TaxID=355587 RepID=A0A6H5GIV6_9HEMI|nr:unnamed protein product [Nesidiocoris tenuis]
MPHTHSIRPNVQITIHAQKTSKDVHLAKARVHQLPQSVKGSPEWVRTCKRVSNKPDRGMTIGIRPTKIGCSRPRPCDHDRSSARPRSQWLGQKTVSTY